MTLDRAKQSWRLPRKTRCPSSLRPRRRRFNPRAHAGRDAVVSVVSVSFGMSEHAGADGGPILIYGGRGAALA